MMQAYLFGIMIVAICMTSSLSDLIQRRCCLESNLTTKFLLKPSLQVESECPAINDTDYCRAEYNRRWACACCSSPVWYTYENLQQLQLEFISVKRHSVLLDSSVDIMANTNGMTAGTASKYHAFDGEDKDLRGVPQNVCQFMGLTVLNLSRNRITELIPLSCLVNFDILNVSYNFLTFIKKTTFTNMERLRV